MIPLRPLEAGSDTAPAQNSRRYPQSSAARLGPLTPPIVLPAHIRCWSCTTSTALQSSAPECHRLVSARTYLRRPSSAPEQSRSPLVSRSDDFASSAPTREAQN